MQRPSCNARQVEGGEKFGGRVAAGVREESGTRQPVSQARLRESGGGGVPRNPVEAPYAVTQAAKKWPQVSRVLRKQQRSRCWYGAAACRRWYGR